MSAAVSRASDVLPHQGILQAFIHRNPLLHFEHMRFDDAVERSHVLEEEAQSATASVAARVHAITGVSPSKRANEAVRMRSQ